MYTEMAFPNADIRFIAINNGVDSANQVDNDMTPFINIFNEFYAKDTSKKVKAVFKAKGIPANRCVPILRMAISKTQMKSITGS